jgi:hypothetical protein
MEQKELVFLTCYLQVILADLKTVTRMIEDQRPYNQILALWDFARRGHIW